MSCKEGRLQHRFPVGHRGSRTSLLFYSPNRISTRSAIRLGRSSHPYKRRGLGIYLQTYFVSWREGSPSFQSRMEEEETAPGHNHEVRLEVQETALLFQM